MENIDKIIRQLTCPVCNRHYQKADISIKEPIDNLTIINVQCSKNHEPVQSIHVIMQKKPENKIRINNIKKQIDKFDGDFIKLWKK